MARIEHNRSGVQTPAFLYTPLAPKGEQNLHSFILNQKVHCPFNYDNDL